MCLQLLPMLASLDPRPLPPPAHLQPGSVQGRGIRALPSGSASHNPESLQKTEGAATEGGKGKSKSRASGRKDSGPGHPRVQKAGKETPFRLREPGIRERRAQSPNWSNSSQEPGAGFPSRGVPEGDHSPRRAWQQPSSLEQAGACRSLGSS